MQSLQPKFCTIHPGKQVAVADPGRNHQANRHEAVCEMRMDNPSPREACVGLPSRPTWAEKRKNGEAKRVDARRPDLDCEGPLRELTIVLVTRSVT